jgi:hypothetical protein
MRHTRLTLADAIPLVRNLTRGEERFPGDPGGIVDPRLF